MDMETRRQRGKVKNEDAQGLNKTAGANGNQQHQHHQVDEALLELVRENAVRWIPLYIYFKF
jgi:hypothetical protein